MLDPVLAGNHTHWSDLNGHVAVVTGGNSGIGLGLAAGLIDAGATVTIWGTNPAKNDAACETLSRGPGKVSAVICDVRDESAVCASMADVAQEHGRLDSCFVNAGVAGRRAALVDTTLESFRYVTSINVEGAFLTLREAARHMCAFGNGGSLVLTSSMLVNFGAARNHAYGVSKAALLALAKSCAVELGRYGIRSNALLPGWTESEMTADGVFADERFVKAVAPRIPARRWGKPKDFAAIAVYLASPASAFHTGDALLLDGGYSAY